MQNHLNRVTRIIIGGTLAVVIWIAGILIGQEQTVTILNPEGGLSGIITRTRSIQTSLMLDFGDGRIKVYPEIKLNYGASTFNLLKQVSLVDKKLDLKYTADPETQEVKNFSINGYNSTEADKKWQVWLNNQLQTEGINQIRLKSGDIIEFKYVKLIETN